MFHFCYNYGFDSQLLSLLSSILAGVTLKSALTLNTSGGLSWRRPMWRVKGHRVKRRFEPRRSLRFLASRRRRPGGGGGSTSEAHARSTCQRHLQVCSEVTEVTGVTGGQRDQLRGRVVDSGLGHMTARAEYRHFGSGSGEHRCPI